MAKDFDVFVEVPTGGTIKYERNEETGELFVDRFLHGSNVFPFNYGSIVNTLSEDGDPLDVIVLSSQPILPGFLIKCHAVGMLEMEDEGGIDTKIIAVPDIKIDPEYGVINDIKDIPQATLNKIKHFFETYKTLELGKWVKVKNFKNKSFAEKKIAKARN